MYTRKEFGVEIGRAAGIMLLPSMALLVEGTTRFVSTPGGIDSSLSNMQEANLVCSVFYVVAGLSGIFTGLSMLIGNHIPLLTQLSLLIQLSLGAVSFINFVFIVPIVAYKNSALPLLFPEERFSRGQQLELVCLGGILMSFFLSSCVQGLQVLCTLVIFLNDRNTHMTKGSWCYYVLAVFSATVLVGAIGEFSFACIVRTEIGAYAEVNPPLVVAANIVTYANIPLITGLMLLLFAFLLIFSIYIGDDMTQSVNIAGVAVTIWFTSAHVMTNIGLAGDGFAGDAAIVTVLTVVGTISPVIVYNEIFRIISDSGKNHRAVVAELDPIQQ